MNRIWGFNAFGHGASLCVVENDEVIFHKMSGDDFLNQELINEALKFGDPNLLCYYEKPFLKRTRQIYSQEWNKAFTLLTPKLHMMEFGIYKPIKYMSHHYSHASAAYYTSCLNDSLILVADAIGEWETLTIWYAKENEIKKLKSYKYPYSLGLFYTAFSKKFKITEKELMIMSLNKKPKNFNFVKSMLDKNLHRGITEDFEMNDGIAASVQKVFVDELKSKIEPFKNISKNIIFAGGCAYNSLAVKEIGALVTINPGDESSSVGAVAGYLKNKIKYDINVNK